MMTVVQIINGCLTTRAVDVPEDASRGRWRAFIQPAIALLCSRGGGTTFVFHPPQDLD